MHTFSTHIMCFPHKLHIFHLCTHFPHISHIFCRCYTFSTHVHIFHTCTHFPHMHTSRTERTVFHDFMAKEVEVSFLDCLFCRLNISFYMLWIWYYCRNKVFKGSIRNIRWAFTKNLESFIILPWKDNPICYFFIFMFLTSTDITLLRKTLVFISAILYLFPYTLN